MLSTAKKTLGVAIIGCGVIGHKRAKALPENSVLRIACDLNAARAGEVARGTAGCIATSDFQQALAHPEINVVIVSTLNASLAEIGLAAVQARKHVLIEKPGALHSTQLEKIQAVSVANQVQVRVGYNHRYHPALQKARELIDADQVGKLMFLRGRYGHGGRTGYDREWRATPALSGGGELIDQGVHLIDLAGWFLGAFTSIEGHASTLFWDMPVDDNAFLSLRNAAGKTAWLQVSCTEWKNLFSLEIYGRTGKLAIDGLGGSYGTERLTFYRMLPEMGPPETTAWEFPRGDQSWKLELESFFEDIHTGRNRGPSLAEGIATLQIVEKIYAGSRYKF
jgi:predicted dehydrogenase